MQHASETYHDSVQIDKTNNTVTISVNPELFPLRVIRRAAFTLIDTAYVILDGDPNFEVTVHIRPKDQSTAPLEYSRLFHNQLLNQMVYEEQATKTMQIRSQIVDAALGNDQDKLPPENQPFRPVIEEKSFGSSDDDPEGIFKPWTDE